MYVYEVAYTIDGESHATFDPGSGVYTALVLAESKQEAFDKVRADDPGYRGNGKTPHVARWKGRHYSVPRGTIRDHRIDIK
jgi:hypothetical protein